MLVRRVGLTDFAHYFRYERKKSATAGIYRNNLLMIIKFRQIWGKME